MKVTIGVIFSAVFLSMLAMTVRATLATPVWDIEAATLGDRWFQATLTDAYLGFLTFYVWVFWREASWAARIVWLVLIITLGTMAMAAYVLYRLWKLPPGAGVAELLGRDRSSAGSVS